ncbi:MAG: hypothetical protein Q607_CBUC00017G0014 [Clostridium butyricum DORA_1]|uniref:hypothetical protein n=1 Tax=Clostridium butyricum TaxID=1492 RepID=UPI0003D5A118|nr:MAG: hypothetical protein Q607_CBUC00017G0014 [Clostridium butyricum DORA_1]MDU1508453.1 hypothetical protein [Clostridium butyricum]MDU4800308.1 hypothetical protein [Clostridium butyricum]DAL23207.1 MAG TPA_asm: hypothetical protein [Caudoviricetes sp.]
MGKILNNPKGYFESLSSDQFEALLNKYGFQYEDISEQSSELKAIKKYIQSVKVNLLSFSNLSQNIKSIQKLSTSINNIIQNSKVDDDICNKAKSNLVMSKFPRNIKKINNQYRSIEKDFLAA